MFVSKQNGGTILDNNIGIKLKHLNKLIDKKVYSLFESDGYPMISYSSYRVLDFLYKNNEIIITQKDIESEFEINRATTSKMLLQLEQKSFIARTDNPEDARSKIVILTESGNDIREHNVEAIKSFDSFLDHVMTEEDYVLFDELYERLCKALS